jgi:hypothetical protein
MLGIGFSTSESRRIYPSSTRRAATMSTLINSQVFSQLNRRSESIPLVFLDNW